MTWGKESIDWWNQKLEICFYKNWKWCWSQEHDDQGYGAIDKSFEKLFGGRRKVGERSNIGAILNLKTSERVVRSKLMISEIWGSI